MRYFLLIVLLYDKQMDKNMSIKKYNATYQRKNIQSLWRAVIIQAVIDATSNSKNSRSISRKKKANHWIGNNRSFLNTCLLADMEPNYVQRKVKNFLRGK